MPTEYEWEQAVQRLIRLTESGELRWQVHPETTSRRENVEGEVYAASVEGRWIAVYQYRFPYYDEDIDGMIQRNEVAVEFIEPSGALQYRWPAVPGRSLLFDAITCAVSGAQDFLKRFLAQPSATSQSQPVF
jgi:hypothetical protein